MQRLGKYLWPEDTDVRDAADDAPGSVLDAVMDPKTGNIACLFIGRGGLLGIASPA